MLRTEAVKAVGGSRTVRLPPAGSTRTWYMGLNNMSGKVGFSVGPALGGVVLALEPLARGSCASWHAWRLVCKRCHSKVRSRTTFDGLRYRKEQPDEMGNS